MQKKKILFIVDEGYPIESAPAVRIDSFLKEVRDQEILLLEGAREQRKKQMWFKKTLRKKNNIVCVFFTQIKLYGNEAPTVQPLRGLHFAAELRVLNPHGNKKAQKFARKIQAQKMRKLLLQN